MLTLLLCQNKKLAKNIMKSTFKNAVIFLSIKAEDDFLETGGAFEIFSGGLKHDSGTAVYGIAEDARADGREGDGFQFVFIGKAEAVQRGALQLAVFVSLAHARSNSMDDISRLKVAAGGDYRTPHMRPANAVALLLNSRSAFAPDSARHATAQLQRRIRRIDNGIRRKLRDVALHQADNTVI